ncbi:MAG: hypothetical protein ACREBQ_03450, partial [Nitrososphaerales archaeon]
PKARFEEVQAAFSQTIPKSELELANTKIAELQATLANSVPRSDLEELTSKMSLLRELISGADVLTEMQAPVAAPMQTNQPLPASIEVANLGPAVETPVVETPSAEPIVEAISAPTQEPVQEVAQPIVEPVVASPPPVEVQAATPEHSTPVEAQTIIGSSGVSETTVAVTNETPVAIPAAETHVAVTASTETNQPAEIREVQSQLSEIKGVQESGQSVISESPVTVDSERGFRFSSTEFCAKSGLEFLEDVEKVDLQILEQHFRSGDFERWFKDVLADESSAESLRTIKGKNCSGEELRTQMVAAIAPKYRN